MDKFRHSASHIIASDKDVYPSHVFIQLEFCFLNCIIEL